MADNSNSHSLIWWALGTGLAIAVLIKLAGGGGETSDQEIERFITKTHSSLPGWADGTF